MTSRRRGLTAVACVVSVVLGSAGVWSGGPTGVAGAAPATPVAEVQTTVAPPPAPAPARLRWKRCPGSPTIDCATLTVPLDYADPAGRSIDLSVTRSRAKNPSKRIGSLLINPGGPGGSGASFTGQAAQLFGTRLTDAFDIVGFDPRGVGASAPVRCLSTKQMDRYLAADPSPDTPAERDEVIATSKQFADGCLARNGSAVLRHLSTVDAARDIDQLRRALGEERITYFGFSYGTLLGATYADLFPTHVRAFALDGALDPMADNDERARLQAIGFEQALKNFTDDCAQRSVCRRRLGNDPMATVDALFAQVETTPFTVGSRKVGPSEYTVALISMLYSQRYGWPRLESAIGLALGGDGAGLLALFDSYVDRNPDGSYRNTTEANAAVNCVDVPSPRDLAHYDQLAKDLVVVAPHFGVVTAYYNLVCALWPVPAVAAPHPLAAVGAPPILVVGTTEDPATPLIWAQHLASELRSGVLLQVAGKSHTAYLSGGPCVRTAVEDYLVALKVPAAGTRC